MSQERQICVGVISGAHGVRGDIRLRSFTEVPEALKRYKPLTDEEGKVFTLKIIGETNNYFIARIAGITSRDAAEALRNTKLYVARSDLPKLAKKQFYESDLVGIEVRDGYGAKSGTVSAVHNYGGGPFLEIDPIEGKAYMLPFTKACVPEVNVTDGYIVIAPPEGWIETAAATSAKGAKPRA